jgi:hypothetical protein
MPQFIYTSSCVLVKGKVKMAERGSVVGCGTMLQVGKVAGSIPDKVVGFFNFAVALFLTS